MTYTVRELQKFRYLLVMEDIWYAYGENGCGLDKTKRVLDEEYPEDYVNIKMLEQRLHTHILNHTPLQEFRVYVKSLSERVSSRIASDEILGKDIVR